MYCKYCGKEIENGREVCAECEAIRNTSTATDSVKQNVVYEQQVPNQNQNSNYNSNSNTGYTYNANSNNNYANQGPVNQGYNNSYNQKSKIAAGLLGIFLGSIGVHNFYLGYTGKAVAQLLLSILSCGALAPISAIWGLIEGILILAGEISVDGKGMRLKD